jgi:hypothetical protein
MNVIYCAFVGMDNKMYSYFGLDKKGKGHPTTGHQGPRRGVEV